MSTLLEAFFIAEFAGLAVIAGSVYLGLSKFGRIGDFIASRFVQSGFARNADAATTSDVRERERHVAPPVLTLDAQWQKVSEAISRSVRMGRGLTDLQNGAAKALDAAHYEVEMMRQELAHLMPALAQGCSQQVPPVDAAPPSVVVHLPVAHGLRKAEVPSRAA